MTIHDTEKTGVFQRLGCPDCHASGELRIESENINENFEVEKQTVIAECPRCKGLGFVNPESEQTATGDLR